MIETMPKFVLSRDGNEIGKVRGDQRQCNLSGCTGRRIAVVWADGKVTMPCSKGCTVLCPEIWRFG